MVAVQPISDRSDADVSRSTGLRAFAPVNGVHFGDAILDSGRVVLGLDLGLQALDQRLPAFLRGVSQVPAVPAVGHGQGITDRHVRHLVAQEQEFLDVLVVQGPVPVTDGPLGDGGLPGDHGLAVDPVPFHLPVQDVPDVLQAPGPGVRDADDRLGDGLRVEVQAHTTVNAAATWRWRAFRPSRSTAWQ